MPTRQPIVSVLGHVDHGKTSLLDRIRGTTVVQREAGLITQHIGATEVPIEHIYKVCRPLIGEKKFNMPGLLFIDTPGHQSFTSLRARGGSLADLAVLVIDINEGLKPQTIESIGILKRFKTPFIIAMNKIDLVEGWQTKPNTPFVLSYKNQTDEGRAKLDEKMYKIIGDLSSRGLLRRPLRPHRGLHQDHRRRPHVRPQRRGRCRTFCSSSSAWPSGSWSSSSRPRRDRPRAPSWKSRRRRAWAHAGRHHLCGHAASRRHRHPRHQGQAADHQGQGHPQAEAAGRDPRPPGPFRIGEGGVRGHRGQGDVPEHRGRRGRRTAEGERRRVNQALEEVVNETKVNIETIEAGVYIKADAIGSLEALAFECKAAGIPIRKYDTGAISKDLIDTAAYGDLLTASSWASTSPSFRRPRTRCPTTR